ncbi:hypothetical protein [Paenibacillus alvei]|uniref:Uncharacterized protein n=1 Tax=Paenibacillus alvei TaxID=44250 RepID=A0AAP7DKJ4_PAEAL|nr:hypothetical protein [Paenibacillus alvei]NOJ73015.1 hypothetical protein [Paenibacillus alvei]
MSKEVNLKDLKQRLEEVEKQLEQNRKTSRVFKYIIIGVLVFFLVTFGIGVIQFISAGSSSMN